MPGNQNVRENNNVYYERKVMYMNPVLLKAIKVAVPVASMALTFASHYLEKKELDELVTKKVSEALAKVSMKKEY